MTEKYKPIPHRLKNMAVGGHVAGAEDIDAGNGKTQQDINADTYRKAETYSKEQLNNMITTPEQEYLSVTATAETTSVADIATLIATKYPDGKESADTVYRVGCWDGEEYNTNTYTEYVWDGTQYIPVGVKNPGIDNTPIAGSDNLVKSGGVPKYNKKTARNISIDEKHLVNIVSGTYTYISDPDYDTVFIYITDGTTKLVFDNLIVSRAIQYDELEIVAGNVIDNKANVTELELLSDTKMVTLTLLRESNTDYDESFVRFENKNSVNTFLSSLGIGIRYNTYYDVLTKEFRSSTLYDVMVLKAPQNAFKINIAGITPFRVICFRSLDFEDADSLIDYNPYSGNVYDGTNYVIILLQKSSNIGNDYAQTEVTWHIKSDNLIDERIWLATANNYLRPNFLISVPSYQRENDADYDTACIPIPDNAAYFAINGVTVHRYIWLDSTDYINGDVLSTSDKINIPDGAKMICLTLKKSENPNGYKDLSAVFSYNANEEVDIFAREKSFVDVFNNYTDKVPDSFVDYDPYGQIKTSANFDLHYYPITPEKKYLFSGAMGGSNVNYLSYFKDDEFLGFDEIIGRGGNGTTVSDKYLSIPYNANKIAVNVRKAMINDYKLQEVTLSKIIDVQNIEKAEGTGKTNKVTVNGSNVVVRTKLSDGNDIIITFWQDTEGHDMSFKNIYVGAKELSDEDLMSTSNLVHSFYDSIGAIGIISFWYLYGQHGWAIPRVNMSSVNVDNSDINSIWQDQNGNRFILAKIDGNNVYFTPEVTLDSNDIYRASWDPSVDPAITQFTHVSGGTHTADITGTITSPQLQIQTAVERKFIADGKIVKDGTYYCDEFIIYEHLLGHNPAFVSYYPNFSYGDSLIDWDRSFIIMGSSVACNTIINTKHKFELKDFRGVIPMMPMQHGEYDSYTLIPKVKKEQNSHRIDLPFISNDGLEQVYAYRSNIDLYDKDNQPERCITFLKDDNDDYLVGVAGGGSLVRGLSVPSIRNQYVPNGKMSMTFGGSSTPNKFYPLMLQDSSFDNGIVPDSFITEFACYFCWFDPNKNEGQVYWYKDADSYILYIHCQTSQPKMEVHLPEFMEGMKVEQTIEKTIGTTLLTEQVVSNRLYVMFDTSVNNANYIVLEMK